MIERLSVRNFILVDALDVEFVAGFNVLTGETGAGKSVLVGALSMLFGARGGGDLVRSGSDEAVVAGLFRVAGNASAEQWLAERGIEPEDGTVLVRRTVRAAGRGTIIIQSVPSTRADLESLASRLIDLHSQHEHQSLLVESNHRLLLDRYGGTETAVVAFGARFRELADLRKRRSDLDARAAERERELELARFTVEEIERARLEPGEPERLRSERDRLHKFEQIARSADSAVRALDDSGALDALKRARTELAAVARIDDSVATDAERLDAAYYEIEDIADAITRFRDGLVFDPDRLESIEERLSEIRALERKHGAGVGEIEAALAAAQSRIDELEGQTQDRSELDARIADLEQHIVRDARLLHDARIEAARTLEREIAAVVATLAMGPAGFVVSVEMARNDRGGPLYGVTGADTVRFLLSTNPGEPPRPLAAIASGGEISRVMLAIKSVLGRVDSISTLVFDEIDTGIGGEVALSIARHMRSIAAAKQLICITHLATIAVHADNHIVVAKGVDDTRSVVTTKTVVGSDRQREIARMLAGDTTGRESLDHAAALLEAHRKA